VSKNDANVAARPENKSWERFSYQNQNFIKSVKLKSKR
jgi:hypothetical protein